MYKEQEIPLPMTPLSRKPSRSRNAYYDPSCKIPVPAEYGSTVGIYFENDNHFLEKVESDQKNRSYLNKRMDKDDFNSSMDNLENLRPVKLGSSKNLLLTSFTSAK